MTMYGSEPPVEGMDYGVVGMDDTTNDTEVAVEIVEYHDRDGFELEGYLAHPTTGASGVAPGLVILPDWDGVNGPTGYEAERAALAAREAGMVAMVADIYGKNYTDVEDMGLRVQLAGTYRGDPDRFVGRIQAGIDVLRGNPTVDPDQIYVAGYCLGGTGAIDYAFSSGALESVRAVVPIHGGLNPPRAVQTDRVLPHVLVLSGGIDDAHGNTTELELQLDGAGASWEITRYSNTRHGFSKWGSGRYNAMADSRSWESMMTLFADLQTSVSTTATATEEAVDPPMEVAPEMIAEVNGSHDSHDHYDEEEDHKNGDHDSHDHDHEHGHSDDEMATEDSSAARALVGLALAGTAVLAAAMV